MRFVQRVFDATEGNGEACLDEDTKKGLRYVEERCRVRMSMKQQLVESEREGK